MRCVALSALVAVCGVAASAQTVADSSRLAYTGTVTRYGTLADALAHANAVTTGSLGSESRDFSLTFSQGAGPGLLQMGTGWSLTIAGPGAGADNPSNVNTGFVQLVDPSLASLGTVTSGFDASRTSFTLNLTGTNALDGGGLAYNTRLWNTTALDGQGGTFLNYDFAMTASGMAAAQWDAAAGMYISDTDPTAVTGYFRGLFQNTSVVTAQNGYYTFDLALNLDSWAYANRDQITPSGTLPANSYQASTFGSAIPEPSTYALVLGLGTLAMAGLRRLRRR